MRFARSRRRRDDVLQDLEWPCDAENAGDEVGCQSCRRVQARSLREDVAPAATRRATEGILDHAGFMEAEQHVAGVDLLVWGT